MINDIKNAVNANKVIKVSKTNIVFNGWIGCGYIIIDTATGNAGYIISEGLSGARIEEALEKLINGLSLLPSGRGFNEIKEALEILGEEISLFWEIYKDLWSWQINYLICVKNNFIVGETVQDLPMTKIIKYLGTMLAAATYLAKGGPLFFTLVAILVYSIALIMAVVLTLSIGISCKDQQ